MGKKCFELEPRDVLFFRDGRPMDVDKDRKGDIFNVGHGANWPRPDQLFSAVIHELLRDPTIPESKWYGTISDLRITGPFSALNGELYLPMPLDWDMKLFSFDDSIGKTDVPEPLTAGFADRVQEKKSYPKWISLEDYVRYLKGEVGLGKGDTEPDVPNKGGEKLFGIETRVGTTLDAVTGASRRVGGRNESGQYEAEYLRLEKDVRMLCAIECDKVSDLVGKSVRFGGQGGMARFVESKYDLCGKLASLPRGESSRFVRWTLLTPALFAAGWYPNWLERTVDESDSSRIKLTGKVMIPMDKVLRRPGELRAAYRARMKEECRPFQTAHLVAACIGKAIAFSGYDSLDREKPTELAVPAGSSYVFECDTPDEAAKLIEALNLKPMSDLGEKGFGFGVCSYAPAPVPFTV